MALTAEQLAYYREYRKNNPEAVSAAYKKWHEANGRRRYYDNVELTRAVKRKCYYKKTGNLEKAEAEQKLIDHLRSIDPPRPTGMKSVYADDERIVRRKAVVRKARYRHVKGIPTLEEPNTCEICGSTGKICLDHCHVTNTFRGWLCDDCNLALGRVKEDINILKAMINYLERKSIRPDEFSVAS